MTNVLRLQERLSSHGYALPHSGVLDGPTLASAFAYVAKRSVSPLIADMGTAAARHFQNFKLDTDLRIAHALSRWAVETAGFTKMEENLNYSAKRLTEVWPRRFPTVAAASPFAGNPRALGNKTYGGRLGNTGPNDGYDYRGRGPTGTTGKANYEIAKQITGVDVVKNPDLVATAEVGIHCAAAFWMKNRVYEAADQNDIAEVCRRIQGGKEGLAAQQVYFARAKAIFL